MSRGLSRNRCLIYRHALRYKLGVAETRQKEGPGIKRQRTIFKILDKTWKEVSIPKNTTEIWHLV